MKINKKGFTLVELLAVIVIIALLSSIAALSYTAFVNSTKDRVYKTYEATMKSAAEMYLIDNPGEIPAGGKRKCLYLNDLLSNNDIDPIKNPDDSNDNCSSVIDDDDSYILIERGEHIRDDEGEIENYFNLTYKVYLRCTSGYGASNDPCSEEE